MSTILAPLPFSEQARHAWHQYLVSSQNINRFRPTPEKALLMTKILNGSFTPTGEKSRRLRHDAKVKYDLFNGRLRYKQKNQPFKWVVTDLEVFDIVVKVHLNLGHAGRRKTFEELDQDYYGISRREVEWLLDHCATCACQKIQTKTAPLKPIVVDKLFERVQVDLIDMRAEPDGKFQWICHLRDHFSKYSQAYPLENKESQSVATAVSHWIVHLGPPYIMHCDNGAEFKGALLFLLRQWGIKVKLLFQFKFIN